MARTKKTQQPVVEQNAPQNNWISLLMEHSLVNGAAISVICISILLLLFQIADWLGFIGLIAFSIVIGLSVRAVIQCYKEGLYEGLRLFASFAVVSTVWTIWTLSTGISTAYCFVFGGLSTIIAVCYIIIAWLQFRNQDTRKGIISVCICIWSLVFAFFLFPFDIGNTENNNISAKTESNLEWWQDSWYCQLNGLDCEICFRNETSVVLCMGGRYNKSAITRFGTYEKHGNTIIATFPGGEGNMTFRLSGRKLIWTTPEGASKTLVLYDER